MTRSIIAIISNAKVIRDRRLLKMSYPTPMYTVDLGTAAIIVMLVAGSAWLASIRQFSLHAASLSQSEKLADSEPPGPAPLQISIVNLVFASTRRTSGEAQERGTSDYRLEEGHVQFDFQCTEK